jgi:hypothetical protein
MTTSVTDSKYHIYYAMVFAKMAERHAFFGFVEEARFWTKICIYHLALAFHRLSFECGECERYR